MLVVDKNHLVVEEFNDQGVMMDKRKTMNRKWKLEKCCLGLYDFISTPATMFLDLSNYPGTSPLGIILFVTVEE